MLPKGFYANGLHSGIAKKKNKKDLALFYSAFPCTAAGMFTANIVKAAPVLVSMDHLKKNDTSIRAVVANSGGANACTSTRGKKDAIETCSRAAELLGLKSGQILVASTGVIGQFLPMNKVRSGLTALCSSILNRTGSEKNAVEAIMTTDTFAKTASATALISKENITVWGCVKGAGMIHPDLKSLHATMLSFILTDAAVSPAMLDAALAQAVRKSFNCVSVDGDTSTNDTVVVLANGVVGNEMISKPGKHFDSFAAALEQVCIDLARQIARDGEGATRLVEIRVRKASSEAAAHKVAATIATSPLVKTAIFGHDANWGRVIGAAGRAGVHFDPEKVDMFLGDMQVARAGMPVKFSEARAKKIFAKKEVVMTLALNNGSHEAVYYTCDLSYDYVKINGSYRS